MPLMGQRTLAHLMKASIVLFPWIYTTISVNVIWILFRPYGASIIWVFSQQGVALFYRIVPLRGEEGFPDITGRYLFYRIKPMTVR